ncbi:RICIN domain-containing protein [Kutzneria sp. CA-103260]|uniref:RICIN domain-containing protein n=1 Tax=Kutzneria sp. CA-103260 TaxID=2802641 RepID=UPI001BEFDBF0|nr:RICIN domain-containing protein [Kutzneria sp. CA-103260]QUQ71179.1 beta-xylosidase [Kutzneria sp. CA-103260]
MKKRMRISCLLVAVAVLAFMGLIMAPSVGAAYGADVAQGQVRARVLGSFWAEMHNRNSGSCVDVRDDSYDAGAWIQQYHCHNHPAQKFFFADMGNGYYEIEGQHSHKCITPQGGWLDNGVPLLQWYCLGYDNQQWQFQSATGGSYRVVNKASGKCIDVPNWSSNDSVILQQWICSPGAANQEFYLV